MKSNAVEGTAEEGTETVAKEASEEGDVEVTIKAAEEESQEADEVGLEVVIKRSAVEGMKKNILRQLQKKPMRKVLLK